MTESQVVVYLEVRSNTQKELNLFDLCSQNLLKQHTVVLIRLFRIERFLLEGVDSFRSGFDSKDPLLKNVGRKLIHSFLPILIPGHHWSRVPPRVGYMS